MLPSVSYSIEVIKDEAKRMVDRGEVNRQQPIYTLCCHFPPYEWNCIECELERNDYLLRDRIIDLLGCEQWAED